MFSAESRASISVGFRKHPVFTKHSLLCGLDRQGGKQQQQRIHLGNQQIVLNQNTNGNTGYSILAFKMSFKVPGKIIPISESL